MVRRNIWVTLSSSYLFVKFLLIGDRKYKLKWRNLCGFVLWYCCFDRINIVVNICYVYGLFNFLITYFAFFFVEMPKICDEYVQRKSKNNRSQTASIFSDYQKKMKYNFYKFILPLGPWIRICHALYTHAHTLAIRLKGFRILVSDLPGWQNPSTDE